MTMSSTPNSWRFVARPRRHSSGSGRAVREQTQDLMIRNRLSVSPDGRFSDLEARRYALRRLLHSDHGRARVEIDLANDLLRQTNGTRSAKCGLHLCSENQA